ncbi:hypothetical protein ACFSTA_07680 [Ornithinibacillus salinisoli]|uniref:Uncharacterized protein n=1 Tax=Ornithinibacillus salinisoli TaxID=1848459 RepID=A0ABW4W374_9BACI
MKKIVLIGGLWLFMICLVGCDSSSTTQASFKLDGLDNYDVSQTSDEVNDEIFIYRLVVEKEEYQVGQPVKIYAELEYTGENEEITIYHAASPFYFPIEEKVRGFDIGYGMDEPLISTTLKKGEPLREVYVKNAGYSDIDEDDYVSFIKRFLENDGFPSGFYVVSGYADFTIYSSENTAGKKDFRMEAQIDFKVVE